MIETAKPQKLALVVEMKKDGRSERFLIYQFTLNNKRDSKWTRGRNSTAEFSQWLSSRIENPLMCDPRCKPQNHHSFIAHSERKNKLVRLGRFNELQPDNSSAVFSGTSIRNTDRRTRSFLRGRTRYRSPECKRLIRPEGDNIPFPLPRSLERRLSTIRYLGTHGLDKPRVASSSVAFLLSPKWAMAIHALIYQDLWITFNIRQLV